MIRCLLCDSYNKEFFLRDKFRDYFRCSNCSLIFVPRQFHVSREKEKARYEEHNNDEHDKGYRDFITRIVEPIKGRLTEGGSGLDFGCGPTPLLAKVFREEGFAMEVYDSFYEVDKTVLGKKYDFVVSTEVLEHLGNPLNEIKDLFSLLQPGGILAIMTLPFDSSVYFRGWHYKNDSTHICFYSVETFDWLSAHLGITYERIGKDIFIFTAPLLSGRRGFEKPL